MQRLIRSVVLVAAVWVSASPAWAQNPQLVLSWGGLCPTPVRNMDFSGPGTYELWIGAKNLTANDANVGSDIALDLGPTVADAWRFDNAGCQGPSLFTAYSSAAHADTKACPTMIGTSPLTITSYQYDPTSMSARLLLGVAYNRFTPSAGVTYTLWTILFNHQNTVGGNDGDPLTCDNGLQPMTISVAPGVDSTFLNLGSSDEAFTFADPRDRYITWNGSCPTTAVQPSPRLVGDISLRPPYPNPASGDSRVEYTLPSPSVSRVEVFDVAGRFVRLLHDGWDAAGEQSFDWDGKDSSGHGVRAGTYFIRIEVNGHTESEQVVRVP